MMIRLVSFISFILVINSSTVLTKSESIIDRTTGAKLPLKTDTYYSVHNKKSHQFLYWLKHPLRDQKCEN